MGRSTDSDVCFNVMIVGEWPEFQNIIREDIPEEYIFGDLNSHIGHGWYITGETVQTGKNLRLWSWEFSKEIDGVIHVVNATNTSQYSNADNYW